MSLFPLMEVGRSQMCYHQSHCILVLRNEDLANSHNVVLHIVRGENVVFKVGDINILSMLHMHSFQRFLEIGRGVSEPK